MSFEDWEGHKLLRIKWVGIIQAVNNARVSGKYVDLKLSKDDIVKICGIKEGDREYYHGVQYLGILIRLAAKKYIPDVKVSVRAGFIHIKTIDVGTVVENVETDVETVGDIVEKKEKIEKVGIEKVETIEKKEKITVENIEPVEYDKIFDF